MGKEPMMQTTFIVVAYDIPDDKRRTRLYNALLAYGTPVQFSIFECLLLDKEVRAMKRRARAIIKPRIDHLRFYPLCASCQRRIEVSAASVEPLRQEDVYVA